ncbi:MAG: TatD family hydrolase [Clostridia bacterium]|nr:TatD family hydrolase [Clostridia bacterium]MBR3152206.1 TatD family hydrolase [Clostridia bacterium]MBR3152257.1 TatD family hydrolase [Clostridia bacterium]
MDFFDSHAHYNDERFLENRDDLIKRMYKNEITGIICAGYNLDSSIDGINFAKSFPHMYATCGISPNDIDENVDNNIKKIESVASDEKVVAIGEIGLDYYWNKDNKEKQKEVFIKQIEIADKLDLPIVIHTRDATIDTINILKEHCPKKKGVFHCCPLNQELIKEGLKLGFYISFSGNITFKNAKAEPCVELVPMDKILIETDSPYLAPEPLRGTTNISENVKLVAKKIAEIKEISIDEIAKITFDNTKRIFRL